MKGVGARPRAVLAAALGAALSGASGPALAQAQQQTPPPPQPPTTTVEEPVTRPERPTEQPAPAPVKQGPAHVPPDASGIDLSEIEGQVRESSSKKIGEVVNAHPEEALAIIRTWLHQPV